MKATADIQHRYAAEHALPFAIIFDELFTIRPDANVLPGEQTLTELINEWLPGEGIPRDRLREQIAKSEHAYKVLEEKKRGKDYHVSQDAECAKMDRPLLGILHGLPRTALCLSGGGIRSASFSLGVLQALAEFNNMDDRRRCKPEAVPSALEEFDYLSTVSGGGYIGSWLMAWTYRLAKIVPPGEAFRSIAKQLAGCAEHTSSDPAPRPLRHLREYTSFLAPKLGLTLDTWTLAALVLRNLLVNWAMILPLVLALVAGLQTLHYGIFSLSIAIARNYSNGWWWAIGLVFVFAGLMAGFRMPSTNLEERAKRRLGAGFVFCVFILPLILASLLLVELWLDVGAGWIVEKQLFVRRLAIVGFIGFISIPIVRGLWVKGGRKVVRQEHRLGTYLLAGAGAALVTSVLLAISVHAVGAKIFAYRHPGDLTLNAREVAAGTTTGVYVVSPFAPLPARPAPAQAGHAGTGAPRDPRKGMFAGCFVLFGFPILWLMLITASALFSGFLGIFEEDVDREWWARSGGMMLTVLAAWVIAEAIVIAPEMIHELHRFAETGLLAGLVGALGGASTAGGLGAAGIKRADVSTVGRFLNKFGMLVPSLCALAMLMLAVLMTVLEIRVAHAFGGAESTRVHMEIFVGAALVGLLVNWAININIFSLHGMYRMRLMRAFLGASNTQRLPNPFTGFDDHDNVYEKDLPTGRGLPLHLVNTTVNLVGTKNLAWQQRKAEGFTISPLHCGGWRLGYVQTAHYGRRGGLSLGTAMAISGAAFNPNMGYHSSPLVTLVMTLFNVRLGWWLPNPKYKRTPVRRRFCEKFGLTMRDFLEKKAPRLALGPLLREALGGTDDLSAYIELTDGGHFENLGLYEMVLRRTKLIVVVDAGADPKCQFEDLGNALRKIEIDMGIPIVFQDGIRMQSGPQESNHYCALAEIHYEYVDRVKSASAGKLLYIKAGITGQEPPDITQYAKTHSTFPHESTANQFFNEAQFESYRHLGHHALRTILKHGQSEETAVRVSAGGSGQQSLQALFHRAKAYTEAGASKL